MNGAKLFFCAQNFGYADGYGASTGTILIHDLKKLGCRYAMIGHSEVRHRHPPDVGESDELIELKLELCLKNGVTPVLCFGEELEDKKRGRGEEKIVEQLESAISKAAELSNSKVGVVLAYEPVWAISSSKGAERCDLKYVEKIGKMVKGLVGGSVKYRFLYGGSVDDNNVAEYLSSSSIDGVIVGRAGTKLEQLKKIINESNREA